ncbi:hypothetical protein SK143_1242 [Streptococcus oralis]|uniref:Uncharacterized protein n=1 Tax=Streptococcus oralis TaxID=1303 RepID=A0A081R4J6_STROR|nr:hypothetical protein BWR56_1386 [Streptococcus oralis]KEQ50119.1 hypothetical protein SK143_1242 [Streptococcus oralis]
MPSLQLSRTNLSLSIKTSFYRSYHSTIFAPETKDLLRHKQIAYQLSDIRT